MSERRRGLGKGLGALIPSAPTDQDRPRDVFFPRAEETGRAGSAPEESSDGVGFTGNHTQEPDAERVTPGAGSGRDGDLTPVPGASFAQVPVEDIRPNPRQPREAFDEDELAELVLGGPCECRQGRCDTVHASIGE